MPQESRCALSADSFVSASADAAPNARRRGLGGLIDKVIVPEEDDRDTIFQVAMTQGRDIFFRHLIIRPDGGLSKRNAADTLYTRTRAVQVAVALGFVAFNSYTVGMAFGHILSVRDEHGTSFALLINSTSQNAARYFWIMQLAVASFEVASMLAMLSYVAFIVIKYNCFITEAELRHYRIWHQLNSVCCDLLPTAGNFSAMKTLQFLNPQILSSALSLELTKVEEGYSYCRVITHFLISRLVFGVLGFVAFAIKIGQLVVQLQTAIDGSPYGFWLLAQQIALLFGFINQSFGITQISQVETSRLFLFIFGGEDSRMQAGELDRQETYLACAMRFVCVDLYADLPPARRKLHRAVAMLSFTHLDIQSLVLAEDETQEVDAEVIRSRGGDGRV